MNPLLMAILLVSTSCASRSPGPGSVPHDSARSSVALFLHVLQSGGPLFGLGAGCDAWRAAPDPKEASRCSRGSCVSGQLESEIENGKIYGFSYVTTWDGQRPELFMSGRGSSHPAVLGAPDSQGYILIGSASMCVEEVSVGDAAGDAVSIGSDTWYLTREACMRARGDVVAQRGCGAASRAKEPGP